MEKIIIIGCSGSGKTTFAEKLSQKTGIELFYLDSVWHKPDRTHISREEFDKILPEILAKEAWIIDGNYQRTLETRMKACDTVVFFDLPTDVCLDGATARLGKARYDLPWIDYELDTKLKEEIEAFPTKNRPQIYELLEKYGQGREIVIFKSRAEAEEFLNDVASPSQFRYAEAE